MKIERFQTIDSTNEYLKKLPGFDAHICIANKQTHGQGQRGRSWHSPANSNIYFSIRYPFAKNINKLSGLSIAVSVILRNILKKYIPNLKIKWPNDIFHENKKLAGILIELINTPQNILAIIGIGINVNMTNDNTQSINQPWTSIKQITNKNIDTETILQTMIKQIPAQLQKFSFHGLSDFVNNFHENDFLKNKHIKLTQTGQTFTGKYQGVDNNGALIIRSNKNITKSFLTGSISIFKNKP